MLLTFDENCSRIHIISMLIDGGWQMNRYFELGVYEKEKSDGTGVLGRYSSFNEAKEAINSFNKEDNQIFIIDELEEQDDNSVRQLGEWLYR